MNMRRDIDVDIRPMRRRDVRRVVEIEREVHPKPWSMGIFLGEVANRDNRAYFIAQVDGETVGYGGLMRGVDEAHITNISVDPKFQRMQIASRMLSTLIRQSLRWNLAALTLEVRASNVAAQGLYRKFGFAPVGVRPRYYDDSGEDAIIMWLYDADTPTYMTKLSQLEDAIVGSTEVYQ